jgi:uncharacterized protein
MSNQCPECGSDRVHRSRLRPGERTALNWYLVPLRCRDCKARFWKLNHDVYFVATLLFSAGLLLLALAWIIIPSNEITAKSEYYDPAQSLEPGEIHLDSKLEQDVLNGVILDKNINKSIDSSSEQSLHLTTSDANDHRLYTVHLYLEKAVKGSADAQYQLGTLYRTGKGTLQDFEEAAKWFKSAAEQNHAPAQYELGLLYHHGLGVDLDNERSYMWLNLAAAAGIEHAAIARDKVMRSLSTKQLAHAQKESREWLDNYQQKRRFK